MGKKHLPGMIAILLALIMIPCVCCGEQGEQKDGKILKLEDITVKGQAMPVADRATTVNIVDSETIQNLQLDRTDEILKEVPGLEVANYNMGGVANAIAIRGFKLGGHGGDLGVHLDGIPLNDRESHNDGYADMNVIIPMEIDHLEVYKGPSSALFGNFAKGGALSFHTRKGGAYSKLKTEYGSFDTVDIQGIMGTAITDKISNNTAIQLYRTNGYQDNQQWVKGNAATRFTAELTDRLEAGVSFRFHESDWDAPGYLSKEQFDADERQSNGANDGGDKTFYAERLDLGYTISRNLKLLCWGYGIQQEFTRFFTTSGPQYETYYDRDIYGIGTSLNFDLDLASCPATGVLGLEYYSEDSIRKDWETDDRTRMAQTTDRKFNNNTISLFGEADMEISRYFRPHLGLRYDSFDGDYEDRRTSSEQTMQDYDYFSPKLGFRSRILDSLDLRVSYAEGFGLPNSTYKYDPAVNVDPSKISQYEIGLTFTPVEALWLDATGFILDTDDEIQQDPSGTYRNIGRTRRKGIELAAKFSPVEPLELFGDVSFIDPEIEENADSSLIGKEVEWVPESVFNLGLKYDFDFGLAAMLKWRAVGEYWLDKDNTEKYEGYDVVDAGLSYTFRTRQEKNYRLFANIDNLLNEHYASSVWSRSGNSYYAVGWPMTIHVGISMDM